MDRCFRVDAGKIIVVYPEEGHGSGDYATAYKIASNFHTEESVPKDQIVLAATYPERFTPFNELEFEVVHRVDLFYEKINSVALLVLAPLTTPYFPLPSFPPSLGLFEYGLFNELQYKKPLTDYVSGASFGLLEDEIGVMIDPELKMWKMSGVMRDPYTRIGLLTRLPNGLQRAILGDSASEEVIRGFAETKKLYLGYAHYHEPQESFIKSVFEYEKEHFPVIFLPNCNPSSLSSPLREVLEVISYDMSSDTYTLIQSPPGNRGRIIVGNVSNSAFKTIMGAAERQTLTTGDSSAAEAISAGKLALYEQCSHKVRFGDGLVRRYGSRILVFDSRLSFSPASAREVFIGSEPVEEDPSSLDAWPKVRSLSLERLEKGALQIQPLRYPGREKMEFDTPYIILPDEVSELLIDQETNRSSLPEFSDSHFSLTLATVSKPSVYLIIRKK